ncbi:hypothetical protein HPB52_008033 [Rhipicephalus sanguineus]|uniref:Tick transposon n=1 Tax=Rhipicephalus sanguineus TaxID=34632 RepID=A0A9D4QI95_RHISA|nr:hypothetical protein HPB52_008033 [Rhipicephalus sanguineus]
MDELSLVVLNEPASHTRISHGTCRDTSPDLSIWSDAGAIAWLNSFDDLGSDHRVLCVTVGEDENEWRKQQRQCQRPKTHRHPTQPQRARPPRREDATLTRRDAVTQAAAAAVVVRDPGGGTRVEATGCGVAAIDTTTASVVAATEVVAEAARNQRYADCYAKEFPTTCHEMLGRCRKDRKKYREPHARLHRSQAVDLRGLQSETFTNPYHLHRLWPALHPSPGCRWCEHGRLASLKMARS